MGRILTGTMAVFIAFVVDAAPKEGRFRHSGQVRDGATRRNIREATVVAFASTRAALSGDCLSNDGALDASRTSARGKFELAIPANVINFVTRYCADGFATRVETTNDNDGNTPIAPEPIILVRVTIDTSEMATVLKQLRSAVARELRYLERRDSEGFYNAIAQLPEHERQLFIGLRGGALGQYDRDSVSDGHASRALRQLSDNVNSDFAYLRHAAHDILCSAAPAVPEFEDYTPSDCVVIMSAK